MIDFTAPYGLPAAVLQELVHLAAQVDVSKAAPAPPAPRLEPTFENGVAVISVEGFIAKRPSLFRGLLFTETIISDIAAAFTTALSLPEARAIVLAIDSPGGGVDGVADLARVIYSARGKKPIVAWSDGMICSAAYWIGAAADAVYVSGETVQAGSIGVVAAHRDFSKAEEQRGVKTTEITAGRYKRIASQYAPLSSEGRQEIQDAVDYIYSAFVGDVAKFRGVSEDVVLERMADGKVFLGRQALDAGLIDGVSDLDSLVSQLSQVDVRQKPQVKKSEEEVMDFMRLVRDEQARAKCSLGKAMLSVSKTHPKEHQVWLRAQQEDPAPARPAASCRFLDLVAKKVETDKCSRGSAMLSVARSHPAEHKEWLKGING